MVRDMHWQMSYMEELGQQIISVIDNAGVNVPVYLREHRPAKFAPEILLPQLSAEMLRQAQAHIEEVGAASEEEKK